MRLRLGRRAGKAMASHRTALPVCHTCTYLTHPGKQLMDSETMTRPLEGLKKEGAVV